MIALTEFECQRIGLHPAAGSEKQGRTGAFSGLINQITHGAGRDLQDFSRFSHTSRGAEDMNGSKNFHIELIIHGQHHSFYGVRNSAASRSPSDSFVEISQIHWSIDQRSGSDTAIFRGVNPTARVKYNCAYLPCFKSLYLTF
ncbi:hypothetical protein D3C75_797890 [compost metagenome]